MLLGGLDGKREIDYRKVPLALKLVIDLRFMNGVANESEICIVNTHVLLRRKSKKKKRKNSKMLLDKCMKNNLLFDNPFKTSIKIGKC